MRTAEPSGKTAQVSRMFARIAPRYDLMNRLMSAGQDQHWRGLAARIAGLPPGGRGLDVATGTGDLAIAVAAGGGEVVGLDPCTEMVGPGRAKAGQSGSGRRIQFLLGDGQALPFATGSFDCVTVAFGVRNLADPLAGFREMWRVLKPGGRAVCLEIMRPRRNLVGRCYDLYLTRFIPLLGGWVSGQPDAYEYLSGSVKAFKDPEELRAIMEEAGFWPVTYRTLNLGAIGLHLGIKG